MASFSAPPTFILDVEVDPSLSRQAWLARMKHGSGQLAVTCGPDVEHGKEWFFEGAWAGSFSTPGFLEEPAFGTGARIDTAGVIFTPPDHVLDRLYLLRDGGGLWLSNSLAFLLARSGAALDPDISDYSARFADIRWGLQHRCIPLPLQDGRAVEVWSWDHLHVSTDLEVQTVPKTRHLPFTDYRSYVRSLTEVLAKVFDNASDPARRRRYTPLATISSGYDSTAIAALAAEIGCLEALTFPSSRGKIGKASSDDSGQDAAAALGLRCQRQDRLGYRSMNDLPEIETLGAGCELSSARDIVSGRLLLTGYMGDSMWDRVPATDLTDLRWPIIAGHNMTELRLASGFINLPVPFIGCRQHRDIIAVTQSEEMKPWTLGTAYDRPICRRIAEERGVPREAFGQTKRAAGVFFREEGLEQTMAPGSYADYTAYRMKWRPRPGWRTHLADRRVTVVRVANGIMSRAVKMMNRLPGLRLKAPAFSVQPGPNTEASMLFHWSQDRLSARYGGKAELENVVQKSTTHMAAE